MPAPRSAIGVRPATLHDLAAVERIARQAYAIYIPRLGREPSTMNEDYRGHIEAGVAHVATISGAPVGFAIVFDRPGHLYLDNLAVHPGHQGRGVGGKLMAFVESLAVDRGRCEIRLTTNPHMTENRAMYAHLGFVETGYSRDGAFEFIHFRKLLSARA